MNMGIFIYWWEGHA